MSVLGRQMGKQWNFPRFLGVPSLPNFAALVGKLALRTNHVWKGGQARRRVPLRCQESVT
jgi:hypothetical protein